MSVVSRMCNKIGVVMYVVGFSIILPCAGNMSTFVSNMCRVVVYTNWCYDFHSAAYLRLILQLIMLPIWA